MRPTLLLFYIERIFMNIYSSEQKHKTPQRISRKNQISAEDRPRRGKLYSLHEPHHHQDLHVANLHGST